MKRCSNELVFRKMQIKIILWRQEAGLQIFSKKQLEIIQNCLKKKKKHFRILVINQSQIT